MANTTQAKITKLRPDASRSHVTHNGTIICHGNRIVPLFQHDNGCSYWILKFKQNTFNSIKNHP